MLHFYFRPDLVLSRDQNFNLKSDVGAISANFPTSSPRESRYDA